ncbi:uncharacterized protein B0H18DRAFT_1038437 [Fomitopsis serialis]|uniref:uncharacterized protein n=1 Tax=Fomitopsis serialis TaxID=139415 RepID=UPI00200840B4|nr:uncharacterized protein B0H18DRAFT_1038437 [Neoantrodia serialis]KAH9916442.1 hypothetical protein B0H18DRAFT_1038437 [Neoantrodia serialis]
MWTLAGPFDCDERDIPTYTKRKLLKSGVKYVVGRKELDDAATFVIKQKKISRHHFVLNVIDEPNADSTNPNYRPKLTIVNPSAEGKRNVARRMDKASGAPPATLNPDEIVDVDDGDVVHVILNIRMSAHWVPVACLAPPTRGIPPPDPSTYTSLGICVRPTSHPDVTHHLSSTINLSPELALSLLSLTNIVTPEWLADLLKAGRAQKPGAFCALEETFLLPLAEKYRPVFSQTLPPALKTSSKWAPNEARVGMFRGCRFIFVGEKGREVQEAMRELVKRGEGEYECFAVEAGRAGLRKVLAKGRAKGRILVLVGEEDALVPAVGKDGWQELVDEANSFEINFTSRERILQAVVDVDTSLLNPDTIPNEGGSPQANLSPLPDVVPNTHPDEPSIPPPTNERVVQSQEPQPTRSRLRRRVGSRASSRVPSPPPAAPAQPAPAEEAPSTEQPKRKGLIRRAGRSRAAAIDDSSMNLDSDGTPAPSSQVAQPPPEPARAPSVGPEPTPARSRLKRRAGTHAATSDIIDLTADAPAPEPPLKKFRALFEQSDPDRVTQSGSLQTQLDSVTESESMLTQVAGGATRLAAVAEEEEESARGVTQGAGPSAGTQAQSQGVKRKGRAGDEDVEIEDEAAPASKRRAVEGADAVQPSQTQAAAKPPSRAASKPPSKPNQTQKTEKASGAAPGKPDIDEAFLKAVASTKKGKRAEDTFDREFNNLRISKPELEQAQERDAWAVLDEFGDDGDLRGNFMVIVEMEVHEKPQRPALVRGDEERADWAGRVDFKKFKKKSIAGRKPAVEVYADDENDYDISSQLWKGSQARSQLASQSQSQSQETHKPESTQNRRQKTQTQTQKTQSGKAKAKAIVLDDSDEDAMPPPPTQPAKSQRKAPSRAGSALPRAKTHKTQPLFIESDEEEAGPMSQTMADDDDFDAIKDADELDMDDDVSTLRSSGRGTQSRVTRGTKKGGASKATAPVILDDDSDDEAAYVGFASRKNTRRR